MLALALFLAAACRVPPTNEPPGAPEVELSPADPTTTDDLQAVIVEEAEDINGDEVTYLFEWYQDGTERSDLAPRDRHGAR